MFHLAFAPLEEPPRIQTHRFFISREIYCIEQLRLYNAEDCDVMLQWTVVLAQEFDDGRRKRITKEFGGASGSTDLMAGKVMFLRSNQGGRLDGNESVADSFRSDLLKRIGETWCYDNQALTHSNPLNGMILLCR
ncbi:hypothetical protein TNCV_3836471 [Trichonephila clavipes]|nr:hypothetical protein TNCV_3836471 [Trichonephila clavipes]